MQGIVATHGSVCSQQGQTRLAKLDKGAVAEAQPMPGQLPEKPMHNMHLLHHRMGARVGRVKAGPEPSRST